METEAMAERYWAAKQLSDLADRAGSDNYNLALGYVWGRQDAGEGEHDSGVAIRFAQVFGEVCALYAAGRLPYRQNVSRAWENWQRQGDVLEHTQVEFLERGGRALR